MNINVISKNWNNRKRSSIITLIRFRKRFIRERLRYVYVNIFQVKELHTFLFYFTK